MIQKLRIHFCYTVFYDSNSTNCSWSEEAACEFWIYGVYSQILAIFCHFQSSRFLSVRWFKTAQQMAWLCQSSSGFDSNQRNKKMFYVFKGANRKGFE